MNPVVRQLEFYLSDFNLLTDEYTRNLLKMHNNEIPLEVFNTTYKRLKELNVPLEKLAQLVNERSKHMHVNEEMKVVLNRPPRDQPVSALLKLDQHPFKYPNVISFYKQDDKYLCYFYEQAEADELAQLPQTYAQSTEPKTYVKGLILKVSNVPASTKRGDFYKLFEQFGEIRFVDFYEGNEFACVRFKESSPEALQKAVAHFAAEQLMIGENACYVSPVEGDEEKATWDRILNPKPYGSQNGRKKAGRKFK